MRWSRRDFLGHFAWATAALAPAPLRGLVLHGASPADHADNRAPALPEYRLIPHYRQKPPLDDILRHTQAGLDAFPQESIAAELEAVLNQWRTGLKQTPPDLRPLERSLSSRLSGAPFTPSEVRTLRSDTALQVHRHLFARGPSIGRDTFISQLRSAWGSATAFQAAEFRIPSLEEVSRSGVLTRLNYDLVWSGDGFYREERTGEWDIEWERDSPGQWRARKWQALQETRSRAARPVFVDITTGAFQGNQSYAAQLLPGTDYWRTILDAASGIDIYGNVGVACGDIDNDGFDDLYICQPSGLPNRLYRNRGDGTFEDVTEAAGVGVLDNTPCALFADVDNDGHQDLLVVTAKGPLLFMNHGDGTFRFKPYAFSFAQEPQGSFTGAAFGDYDRDGWLDVYFCLYSYYRGLDQYNFPTPYFDARNGPPNFLFRNNRDGTFTDVTAPTGLNQNNDHYSFDGHWCDYDGDGWPDLYVVNDFGRKNLYHNNGDGTFTDVAEAGGVVDVGPGMSACWFDYDNDGRQDLYVSDMWEAAGLRVGMQEAFKKNMPAGILALYRHHAKGNSLFHNHGDGRFEDRSAQAGVERSGWSWSCQAWDFDHDGYPDLYIANGMISGPSEQDLESFFWRQVVSQSPLAAQPAPRYEQGWNAINDLIRSDGTWAGYQRNVFYVNSQDGTFAYAAGAVGLDFPDDSRAYALADYDHDGRLEVFLKSRTGPQLRLLRCVTEDLGDSIAFRLRGRKSNRDAIGAVIMVENRQGRQTKFLQAGTGFCSQHSKEVFFGLGKGNGPVRAQVRWPSGAIQQLENLPVNHRIEIEEGSSEFRAQPFAAVRPLPAGLAAQPLVASPSISETWMLVPLPAPEFELPDLEGGKRTLSSLRGRRVLLNFWARSSPPCEEALRALDRGRLRWAAQGLDVVTVNVDDSGEVGRVRAFVKDQGISLPVLLATDDVAAIYNLLYRYLFDRRRNLGLPTSFLLDEQGMIVKIYQGPVDSEHLTADLKQIPRSEAERRKVALPFSGTYYGDTFERNYFTYGAAFFQHGYVDQAIAWFQLSLGANPQYADTYYSLGTLYLKKEMPTEARQNFERALQFRPNYPDALNNLGMLAAQEGRTDEAERYFRKAIDANPQYVIALQNLGTLYREQKRWAEAQQALERALQIEPDNPEVNYALGMLFARHDQSERAREYLQKAISLRPDYAEALNNLGVLYMLTGKPAEATATFEQCIKVAPAFDQAYLNLARVHAAAGNREKAQEALRQLLSQHPDNAQARKALEQLSR